MRAIGCPKLLAQNFYFPGLLSVLKLSQLSSTPYVSYTLPLVYCVCLPVSLYLSLRFSFPFIPGRFKFRANKGSINKPIDLCGFTGWRKNVGLSCVISNKLFCYSFE